MAVFQGARFSGTPSAMSNPVSPEIPGLKSTPIDPYKVRPLPSPHPATLACADWISRSDSMTRAIGQALGEMPRVHPGHEGPDRLAPWECRLLALGQARGYAREVVLRVAGVPVLTARTVSRLDDPALEVIRRLGNRPLAELLFDDPSWRRASAPIPLLELGGRRFGRTCLWEYGQRSHSRILVSEFFDLPGLLIRKTDHYAQVEEQQQHAFQADVPDTMPFTAD